MGQWRDTDGTIHHNKPQLTATRKALKIGYNAVFFAMKTKFFPDSSVGRAPDC
jgi:hypothetical protein